MFGIINVMNTLTLKQEVKLLRSAVIGIVGQKDKYEYDPNFIKEVFSDLNRKPTKKFTNTKNFLQEIKNA